MAFLLHNPEEQRESSVRELVYVTCQVQIQHALTQYLRKLPTTEKVYCGIEEFAKNLRSAGMTCNHEKRISGTQVCTGEIHR